MWRTDKILLDIAVLKSEISLYSVRSNVWIKKSTNLHKAVVEECDILIPASIPVVETEKSR